MSREEIDRALVRLRDERDRIAASLLDLEGHQGFQLMKGTPLTGRTKRHWETVQEQTGALWELFDAFRRQLDAAEEIRAQQSRPSQERLQQLTHLIAGESVELAGRQLPLQERSLLGPATERMTLESVVTRMTGLYEQATAAVVSVDAVWSVLLTRLDTVEEARREAERIAGTLEILDPELDGLVRRLAEVHATVVGDPLAMTRGDDADTSSLDALAREFEPVGKRLGEAVRMRTEHGERVRAINASIGLVAQAEGEARQAREVVLVKIASPVLPEPPARAAVLAQRLEALGDLRARGRWSELAAAMAALEKETDAALQHARTTAETISGLMERRDELRGRLEAYRAKAGRLGRSEDLELSRLYERARELLWTAPCDLRQATQALAGYQRALTAPSADTTENTDGAGR
jgi:hypothetical protein